MDPLNMTAELLDVDPTANGFPPEPIFSDYLEMTSLVLMFIIGAPLNLAAYTQVGIVLLIVTRLQIKRDMA
ncbi:unnamed protein product [Strongylus vulgaris]|uniref:Uncharacterized protein n=1 Tax=Strongylus vulgaris TaxID=40348 RepID=A0A3P7JIG6_STRVU|nr:unnamed protein product [Strongylus vulgaris]